MEKRVGETNLKWGPGKHRESSYWAHMKMGVLRVQGGLVTLIPCMGPRFSRSNGICPYECGTSLAGHLSYNRLGLVGRTMIKWPDFDPRRPLWKRIRHMFLAPLHKWATPFCSSPLKIFSFFFLLITN